MKIIQQLLIISFIFIFSCNSDDENNSINPEDISLSIEEALQNITSSSSNGIWKIQSAKITNQFIEQEEIASLYNVKDDEFRFSLDQEQILNMSYKRGFAIDSLSQNVEGLKSDINTSTIKQKLTPDIIEDVVMFTESNNYSFHYDEDNETIIGVINFNQESRLDLILSKKNASDFILEPTSLTNPIQLHQFNTGITRVGFKVSQANNALYITNRNDLEIFGGQLAVKIDLDQELTTEFSFVQSDFATKNIEFFNDQIVSIGGVNFEVFNSDFNNIISTQTISAFESVVFQGTATLDNKAYIFVNNTLINGFGDETSFILNWSLNQPNLTILDSLPFELDDMDGEIIDQKLYMFGGFISSTDIGSDKVYIYDLDSNSLSEVTIPVNLFQAFTSVVEHLIYVGGTKSEDINGDGIYERIPYFGVYNTVTSNFQEIDLMVDNVLDERLLSHIQVIENKAYFITNEDLPISGSGFITRVYSADLN